MKEYEHIMLQAGNGKFRIQKQIDDNKDYQVTINDGVADKFELIMERLAAVP